MNPFTRISAIAVPIDEANVDTNQLCPTHFNKVPRGLAYARVVFHDHDLSGRRIGACVLPGQAHASGAMPATANLP